MIMESILSELQKKKFWKSSLKTQCRRNGIDTDYASSFTIVKIRKFFDNPPQLQTSAKPRTKSSVWLQNQLKAYQWLLICFSAVKDVLIKAFGSLEWAELSSILGKEESILEYEALKLISEKEGLKRRWDQRESTILFAIIKEEPESNKWNQIARKLFIESSKQYFRSGKQCRERWFNHLDPHKKRGGWETTEDRFIIDYILEKGKRWSDISRHLQNERTEHMVKNRFKTIVIKLKKEYPEIKPEGELLQVFMSQTCRERLLPQAMEVQVNKEESDQLPIIEGDGERGLLDYEFEIKEHSILDRINPAGMKDFQFQQVVTPCPIIYQNFTPTFLNTPHPLPFLCNFGKFQKNDNLFLKNS